MVQRYNRLARLLHWTMAVLVAIQVAFGFAADWLERPRSRDALDIHAQLGLIVLALALLRLSWRLSHPPPPWPSELSAWHRGAASLVHRALYVLLLVLPLSGYALWMWIGAEVQFLGGPAIPFPDLAGEDEFWRGVAGYTHEYAVYALGALLTLHIGAALMHEMKGGFRPIRDRMRYRGFFRIT